MTEVVTVTVIPNCTAVASNGKLYSTSWSALLAHGDPDGEGEVWLFRSGISGAFFTVCMENGKPAIDLCSSFTAYKLYRDLAEHDAPFSAVVYTGSFA
jgi:hypothetical protein